jgi:hypothetical protein
VLKLKDVPQEQMGEVVRIASEMYDKEHQEKQERSSTVAAAEELGIPEEYLERAAKELQEKRIAEARIKQERKRRLLVGGSIVGSIAVGATLLGGLFFRQVPAAPTLLISPAIVQPQPRINPGTVAEVGTQGNTYVLKVDQFGGAANGGYFANMNIPLNTSLANHRTMTFTVKGEGIPQAKVFLENGAERWRTAQAFTVTNQPQTITINLDNMIRQEQRGGGFRDAGSRSRPAQVENISIKVGEQINSPNVSGTVEISDIQFK